jgi:hypothetical protein
LAGSYDTLGARALVHPLNAKIFLNSSYPRDAWSEAYLQSQPGDLYTPLVRFHSIEEANNIGQVYIKPVGVFHNGNCYSACEYFSSALQDTLGTVVVFGEDKQTGGG